MLRKTKREREREERESAIISVSAADRGKGGGRTNTNYLYFGAKASETGERPSAWTFFRVRRVSFFSSGSFRRTLFS